MTVPIDLGGLYLLVDQEQKQVDAGGLYLLVDQEQKQIDIGGLYLLLDVEVASSGGIPIHLYQHRQRHA